MYYWVMGCFDLLIGKLAISNTLAKELIYLLDINHLSSLPLAIGNSVAWPSISFSIRRDKLNGTIERIGPRVNSKCVPFASQPPFARGFSPAFPQAVRF
jgi:hypothetical protein